MHGEMYVLAGSLLSALLIPGAPQGDTKHMPLSINWNTQRVIPDGNYTITHDEAFVFAQLVPASAIVTPVEIDSIDHQDSIPKGTVLAWDSDHKIACEPMRRRGNANFYCLEDANRSGKFTSLSTIPASNEKHRRGMIVKTSYEYLIGQFSAFSPKPIAPIDEQSFSAADKLDTIDLRIRFESQHKLEQAAYSFCTIRDLGKNILSFGKDVERELCPPEFTVIKSTEMPKNVIVFGYLIRFSDFDDLHTHIFLAKIGK